MVAYSHSFSNFLTNIHEKSTGNDITIAVIDTGIDDNVWFYNQIEFDEDYFKPRPGDNRHGTLVASIINRIAPRARILSIPIMGTVLPQTIVTLFRALYFCYLHYINTGKPQIINLSIEREDFPHYPDMCIICRTLEKLMKAGIFVSVTAGNCGEKHEVPFGTISCPGSAEEPITLGGVADNGDIASFSGKGPTGELADKPDIVAPCSIGIKYEFEIDLIGQTKVISMDGGYVVGTSFSAPYASGIAALLLEKEELTPFEIKEIFINTALDINPTHSTENDKKFYQGSGLINIEEVFINRKWWQND